MDADIHDPDDAPPTRNSETKTRTEIMLRVNEVVRFRIVSFQPTRVLYSTVAGSLSYSVLVAVYNLFKLTTSAGDASVSSNLEVISGRSCSPFPVRRQEGFVVHSPASS